MQFYLIGIFFRAPEALIESVHQSAIRLSRSRGPKRVLRELGSHPADGAAVWLKTGHYGPFVAHRRSYASLPRDVAPDDLTLEQALALLEDEGGAGHPASGGRPGGGGGRKRSRG